MPFINVKTTAKITPEKELALKEQLGNAITAIPGKSEAWLMLNLDDECRMYFKGSNEKPLAYIEVKIFGSASSDAYDKLTAIITDIFSNELNISPDCIYVRYSEGTLWGWNGNNF